MTVQVLHATTPEQLSDVSRRGQQLMARALEPTLHDDRFDQLSTQSSYILALKTEGDEAVGFVGGALDGPEVNLECLVVDGSTEGESTLVALYNALKGDIDRSARPVETLISWAKPTTDAHEAFASALGLTPHRQLHQLRCRLPIDESLAFSPLLTRDFEPGRDDEDLLRVNNRAFANHPDQGRHTRATLRQIFAEPWFRPEGVRLYHDESTGELAGFCWTKIHESTGGAESLGEIFVIGVDPDYHGRGLGVPMTAAGLSWLASQGLTTGMLYVEADNAPALRTYDKLGFSLHRTDRSWLERLV